MLDLTYASLIDDPDGWVDRDDIARRVDKALREPLFVTEDNWGLTPAAAEAQAAMEEMIPMAAPRAPKVPKAPAPINDAGGQEV